MRRLMVRVTMRFSFARLPFVAENSAFVKPPSRFGFLMDRGSGLFGAKAQFLFVGIISSLRLYAGNLTTNSLLLQPAGGAHSVRLCFPRKDQEDDT